MRTRPTNAIGQTNATCRKRFPRIGAQEIFGRPFDTWSSTRQPPWIAGTAVTACRGASGRAATKAIGERLLFRSCRFVRSPFDISMEPLSGTGAGEIMGITLRTEFGKRGQTTCVT